MRKEKRHILAEAEQESKNEANMQHFRANGYNLTHRLCEDFPGLGTVFYGE